MVFSFKGIATSKRMQFIFINYDDWMLFTTCLKYSLALFVDLNVLSHYYLNVLSQMRNEFFSYKNCQTREIIEWDFKNLRLVYGTFFKLMLLTLFMSKCYFQKYKSNKVKIYLKLRRNSASMFIRLLRFNNRFKMV